MNSGKEFEGQWRKNAKKVDGLFFMRIKDSATSYGRNNAAVRFTPDNICDCLMFKSGALFLLELKNTRQPSLSFDRIRGNQMYGLLEAVQINPDIIAGIVCNFEKSQETWFLNIDKLLEFMRTATRKSIPVAFFRENGIQIENKRLRVKYDYNVGKFVYDVLNRKGQN